MPRFAANLTLLFNEMPFMERFAAAREAGFAGVEYLFPYEFDKAELRERLVRNGLTQVLLNSPPGDPSVGERGTAILPDRVDEFRDGVALGIAYATAVGCRQIHCLSGIAPPDSDPSELRRTLVDNLRFAAALMAKAGIKLLIEPINSRDVPGFFVNHTADALDLIADVASDNVFLQYDIYHAQIMEGDLAPTLKAHLPRIAHIQIADTPGRNEPGTGEINYPFLFRHLDAIGYAGWIGCEYHPKRSTTDGLGWYAPYRAAAD